MPSRLPTTYTVAQNGCWQYDGHIMSDGYGRFPDGRGGGEAAHRVYYKRHVGPIPDGLVLDHLCRNRRCVNPAHLEPVTIGENVMRGETIVAANAAKTHCVHGHPLSGDNLYVNSQGARLCRICKRRRDREYKARRAYRQLSTRQQTGAPDARADAR